MSQPTKYDAAIRLFRSGYTAELRGCFVMIHTPEDKTYRVDPEAYRCNCGATVECKHLIGLLDLMLDTSNALDVQALEHLECSRFCWSFSPEGLRLAIKGAALSDRVAELRVVVEGRRREREMERAA